MLSYCHTPKWTPTIASASLIVLGAYFLDAFGLVWGSLCVIGMYIFVQSYYLQSSVTAKRSRRFLGLTIGSIIVTTVGSTYALEVMSESFRVLFALSLLLNCFLTVHFVVTKPLSKHKNNFADISAVVKQSVQAQAQEGPSNADQSPAADLCCICLVDADIMSMHCHECNLCVLDVDHHVTFLNNCVGRGNRRLYVILLVMWMMNYLLFTQCLYFYHLSLCPEALHSLLEVEICVWQRRPVATLLCIASIGAAVCLGISLHQQLVRVGRESTFYAVSIRLNICGFS